jgi:hypothetical protein
MPGYAAMQLPEGRAIAYYCKIVTTILYRLLPRHALVPPLPAVERGRAPPGPGR